MKCIAADKLVVNDTVYTNWGLLLNNRGGIESVGPVAQLCSGFSSEITVEILRNKILVPGFVNASCMPADRLMRGYNQHQPVIRLQAISPYVLYITARQAFIEMALAGTTTIAVWYADLHNEPMLDAVIYAAREVGVRLAVIYRSSNHQGWHIEKESAAFHQCVDHLLTYKDARLSWVMGCAADLSVDALIALKLSFAHLPFYVEWPSSIEQCLVSGIADTCTTFIHASTHVSDTSIQKIVQSGAVCCVSPSVQLHIPPDVTTCLAIGAHQNSTLLTELQCLKIHNPSTALHILTQHGAAALGLATGMLDVGKWADAVAFDLTDPMFAGIDDTALLPTVLSAAATRAISDVLVAGQYIVKNGTHVLSSKSYDAYQRLQASLC